MNVLDFQKKKEKKEKISMVTCYDAWSAKIIAESNIDSILVGDSLAMVMHGYPTTINATVEMMYLHTQAVAKCAKNKFIISDMPFLSHRKGLSFLMDTVQKLEQAGATAIKLEGGTGNFELIHHVVESGIPVMGHLGLTPQSVNLLGGFKTQGKDKCQSEAILQQATLLQEAGCFAIVLECIPAPLAKTITEKLSIPTIGIGAGPDVDGQVLVLQDLLGCHTFKPKFLKTYLNGFELIQNALNTYDKEVKSGLFPLEEHCYDGIQK